ITTMKNIFVFKQFKLIKNVFMLLIVCPILYACSSLHKVSYTQNRSSLYRINKIRSVNDWNIIYATKGDSVYKIISKKSKDKYPSCRMIEKGQYYNLTLNSRKNNPPTI